MEIGEVTVNPASGRAYLLVKNLASKQNLIVSVDSAGQIAPLALTSVPFAAVKLPGSDAGLPRVTEMTWAGDRLVCSARTGEEFAAKVLVIPAPLGTQAASAMISAETYHVSHKLLRKPKGAAVGAIFPFEENGKKYIVGGLGCTPIVKYPIEADSGRGARGQGRIDARTWLGQSADQHVLLHEERQSVGHREHLPLPSCQGPHLAEPVLDLPV